MSNRGRPRTTDRAPRSPFAQALGARLRIIRETSSMTAQQLADAADVRVQRIYGWERGEQVPSSETLCLLASTMGVSLAEFDGLRAREINSEKTEKKR